MKKTNLLLSFLALLISVTCNAQFDILVFHKTNGYRHTSAITEGIKMLQAQGASNNWNVTESQDPSEFDDLSSYKVVVFLNTSGGGLLNDTQKQNLENFIQAGNGFVGIHAATDTYRGTDAASTWPWYNELVGGIVQTSPNHTSNNTTGHVDVKTNHEITDHLGTQWTKQEEWYYWEQNGGWLYSENITLLELQSTGSNSYDAKRPITWYKEYDGGRSFYTAMGHNGSDYSDDAEFIEMIRKAVLWTAGEGEIDPCVISTGKTEAECYSEMMGIQTEPCAEGGLNVGYINDGDYAMYSAVDLTGMNSVKARFATRNAGGSIEFRVDAVDGDLLGTMDIPATGDWQNWETDSINIQSVTGTHDVYLIFKGGDSYLYNLNWFGFSEESNVVTNLKGVLTSPLSIHPNPSTGIFNLSKTQNYKVIDVLGDVVLSGEGRVVDLSAQPSGVYLLRTEAGTVFTLVKR